MGTVQQIICYFPFSSSIAGETQPPQAQAAPMPSAPTSGASGQESTDREQGEAMESSFLEAPSRLGKIMLVGGFIVGSGGFIVGFSVLISLSTYIASQVYQSGGVCNYYVLFTCACSLLLLMRPLLPHDHVHTAHTRYAEFIFSNLIYYLPPSMCYSVFQRKWVVSS